MTWGRHHETRPCYRLQVQVRRKEENDIRKKRGNLSRKATTCTGVALETKEGIPATAPDAKVATQEESKNRVSEEYDPKMVKKDRHYDDYYRDDYRRAGADMISFLK